MQMAVGGSPLAVRTTGLAWGTDLHNKFSSTAQPQNFNSLPALRGGADLPAAPLDTDERFVVWMRTAALSRFRKLWGIIDQDLASGLTLNISIANA